MSSFNHLEQTSQSLNVYLSQILTIEPNVYLPSKLAIFRVNGKTKIAKMDFLHNSTTLLSLFNNKTNVTHLINQNLNLMC